MIGLDHVSIRAGRFALEDISLQVPTGQWCVFMGRTGSGKTTLLEMIAGLRKPASGRILINGNDVTNCHPSVRGIGYVPQDKALFQTMSVRENLAFGLRVRRWTEEAVEARVADLAELLKISGLLNRLPQHLSGGEAQRVALGRALAPNPSVLCLDEPLSALDDVTREEMRAVLRVVRERTSVTTLHVTHHADDGANLADKVIFLRDGRIEDGTATSRGDMHA